MLSNRSKKFLLSIIYLIFAFIFIYSAEKPMGLSSDNTAEDNTICILMHGYPAQAVSSEGAFDYCTDSYFRVPEYGKNYIFGYNSSNLPSSDCNVYADELGNFNDGSRRVRNLDKGINYGQSFIALAKCQWTYRKAFREYFQKIGMDESIFDGYIKELIKSDLRFFELLISPSYIKSKLDKTGFPILNGDINLNEIIAQKLFDYAKLCPNDIKLISHSTNGLTILRYLTAPENRKLYNYYRDYTMEKFGEEIILPQYKQIIEDVKKDQNFTDDQQALNLLYPVFKFERENNVDKSILQDGQLSGSGVADFAAYNFGSLKTIFNDDYLAFAAWKAGMLTAILINVILSNFIMQFACSLMNSLIFFPIGLKLFIYSFVCCIVDCALWVVIVSLGITEKSYITKDYIEKKYRVLSMLANEINLFGPPEKDKDGIDMAGALVQFDPGLAPTMKDIKPGSEFIESYSHEPPPKYTGNDGNTEDTEIYNITAPGVESVKKGGLSFMPYGYGIVGLPFAIAGGLAQFNLFINLYRYLITYNLINASSQILSIDPYINPADVSLGKIFALVEIIFIGIESIITLTQDYNSPYYLEVFIGLVYDLMGIEHEKGAVLFNRSDASGLSVNREINAIANNSNSYVYELEMTTKDQAFSQSLIGNTNVDRDQFSREIESRDYYQGANAQSTYLMCHEWSKNLIFRPLSAITYSNDKPFLFFNNYLFPERNNIGGHYNNSPYGDISQMTRTLNVLKEGFNFKINPETFVNTDELKNKPERDFYHYFMFGYNNGITPTNVALSSKAMFGNNVELYKSENINFDRSIISIAEKNDNSSDLAKKNERLTALNYLIVTNYMKVFPLDIYNYYKGIEFYYSINGEPFKNVSLFNNDNYSSLEAYVDSMKDKENGSSSLLYDDAGKAAIISPHFKEGFNNITIKFVDPAGNAYYKDIQVLQMTVPPFIKPVYPLMNQYVGQNSFTASFQALDISNGAIKPEGWFKDAKFIIKVDGNVVTDSPQLDLSNFTASFDMSNLSDGNHELEITVNYMDLENKNSYRFWIDTTKPEITFPENRIFSNKNEKNSGGIFCNINDAVPFKSGQVEFNVDTVMLNNLTVDISKEGANIENIINKNNIRLGAHSSLFNGWINGQPLGHGKYEIDVNATDRVGNQNMASSEIIIDNKAPVFNSLSMNTNLVNLNSSLLELSFNLGLDEWENSGNVELAVENIDNGEKFGLISSGKNNTDSSYMITYFTNGVNLFKDGTYNINVASIDNLENRGAPVAFNNIKVDRTKPNVKDVFINPFVVKTGNNQIKLKFYADESNDVASNKSNYLNININLLDVRGNIIQDFSEYVDLLVPGKTFEHSFTLPDNLKDGNYSFDISIIDVNGNAAKESATFIRNAMSPEITFPLENDVMNGTTAIYGNIPDPRWDNNKSLLRYELYYKYGANEMPQDLINLSGWNTDNLIVPAYQQETGCPVNYGRFIVEGSNVIGTINAGNLNNDLITILVVVEEEGGYRIGTARTFRILNTVDAKNVSVQIEDKYKASLIHNDFNFNEKISVGYTVDTDINNPVDIYSCIKDSSGKIIKRNAYYDYKSKNIIGKPSSFGDKGVYIYQDTDNRFYLNMVNDTTSDSSFIVIVQSDASLSDFTDMNGNSIPSPTTLINGGKYLTIFKNLKTDSFGLGFKNSENSFITITVIIDGNTGKIYLGNNKELVNSNSVTIYPGHDYPPVIWDGKDDLDRFIANGIYTVSVEAYGKNGGRGSDSCDIQVITPLILDDVEVLNPNIQPNVDTLNYCRIKMHSNKAGSVICTIFNEQDAIIKELNSVNITNPGILSIDWYGDNSNDNTSAIGKYNAEIRFNAVDGSLPVVINKYNMTVLGNIYIMEAKNKNANIKAVLLPFDNAPDFNGKQAIKGDNKYQVVVTPKGEYLPDRSADLTLNGKGTAVVEAYPDLNYMAAIRNNYEELWGKIQINQVHVSRYYNNIFKDRVTKAEDRGINYMTEQKVLSYNIEINKITKNDLTFSGSATMQFSIPKKERKGGAWFDSDFQRISGASISGQAVIYGGKYLDNIKISSSSYSWDYTDWWGDLLSSHFRITCTIYFNGTCPVKRDNDKATDDNSDTVFGLGNYLALADGIAVMGPDIKQATDYSHYMPFIYKGKSIDSFPLIEDPEVSTGMAESTEMSQVWRQKPRQLFYCIGEDYNNYTDESNPKTSVEDLIQFKDFNVINAGGGDAHLQQVQMPDGVSNEIISNMSDGETKSFINGKVKFTVKKQINQKLINQYEVSVESLAEDRICYPFPAEMNKSDFVKKHDIGDNELGIPTTSINGERNSALSIPNYYVPEFKLNDSGVKNVYFNDEIDNKYVVSSKLSFDKETGYTGNFDLLGINNEAAQKYPEANFKKWVIKDIVSDNVEFSGIPHEIRNNILVFTINDSNISNIKDASWDLSLDNNANNLKLYSQKQEIDLDNLNKYGVVKDQRISDLYPFSNEENKSVKNMYTTGENDKKIDNNAVVIDTEIRNYSIDNRQFGYDIKTIGLDNKEYQGLKLKSTAMFGKGLKLSDGYVLELSDKAAKKLTAIYGHADGNIHLSYYMDNDGWTDIPVYNSDSSNNILTYWDITGLEGLYKLRLISTLNNEYNIDIKEVYIGNVINTSGSDAVISAPSGQAKIIFPAGSVLTDTLINVDTLNMEDIKDIAVLPDIAPVGKIIKLTPDGYVFDNVYPQLQFTYNRSEIEKSGIDPFVLVIYNLKDNGELVALNTIKHLIKVRYDDNGNVIGEDIVWDTSINTDVTVIPDYTYVKAWAVTTHFSYYLVLEGDVNNIPRFNDKNYTTNKTLIDISGTGLANQGLQLFVGDNVYYLKDNKDAKPAASTTIDKNGNFSFKDISLPIEGENCIFARYAANNNQYAKLIVARDTTPPIITFEYNDSISPNNDNICDKTEVKINSNENTNIKTEILDAFSNIAYSEEFKVLKDSPYHWIYGGIDKNNSMLSDGEYEIRLTSSDIYGNRSVLEKKLIIDTAGPRMALVKLTEKASPKNLDGLFDLIEIELSIDENASFTLWAGTLAMPKKIKLADNLNVEKDYYLKWDGKDNFNNYVMDGNYFIIAKAIDKLGNVTESVFNDFIKIDNTAPEVKFLFAEKQYFVIPADNIKFNINLNEDSISKATIRDKNDTVVFSNDYNFKQGDNSIEWTVGNNYEPGFYNLSITTNDNLGNTAVKNRTIELAKDTMPPVIICDAQIIFEATDILTPIVLNNPTVTDDSEPVTVISDAPISFKLGDTIVTWKAVDRYGNASTVEQIIKVVDSTPPNFETVPEDINAEANAVLSKIDLIKPECYDIFGADVTSDAPQSGFPIGTTNVTWTAKDSNGNSNIYIQKVSIADTTLPVFNEVPGDKIFEANDILSKVDIGKLMVSDIFNVALTNNAPIEGFVLGDTIVTWTAVDANGNTAAYDQKITIKDTTPPVLIIPDDLIIISNYKFTKVYIGKATSTDIFKVTITNNAPKFYPQGLTRVKWTAVDANGNITTKVQKVIVMPRFMHWRHFHGRIDWVKKKLMNFGLKIWDNEFSSEIIGYKKVNGNFTITAEIINMNRNNNDELICGIKLIKDIYNQKIISNAVEINNSHVYLKIIKEGNSIISYTSKDGDHWQKIEELKLNNIPDSVYAGIYIKALNDDSIKDIDIVNVKIIEQH